jgi:hypothetical protein
MPERLPVDLWCGNIETENIVTFPQLFAHPFGQHPVEQFLRSNNSRLGKCALVTPRDGRTPRPAFQGEAAAAIGTRWCGGIAKDHEEQAS